MWVVRLQIHPRAGDISEREIWLKTISSSLCRRKVDVFVNKKRTESN